VTTEIVYMEIYEKKIILNHRVISLCIMNDPGQWGVIQASSSIAEASDKGRTVTGLMLGVVSRNIL